MVILKVQVRKKIILHVDIVEIINLQSIILNVKIVEGNFVLIAQKVININFNYYVNSINFFLNNFEKY